MGSKGMVLLHCLQTEPVRPWNDSSWAFLHCLRQRQPSETSRKLGICLQRSWGRTLLVSLPLPCFQVDLAPVLKASDPKGCWILCCSQPSNTQPLVSDTYTYTLGCEISLPNSFHTEAAMHSPGLNNISW